jgi:hypothetical protein
VIRDLFKFVPEFSQLAQRTVSERFRKTGGGESDLPAVDRRSGVPFTSAPLCLSGGSTTSIGRATGSSPVTSFRSENSEWPTTRFIDSAWGSILIIRIVVDAKLRGKDALGLREWLVDILTRDSARKLLSIISALSAAN